MKLFRRLLMLALSLSLTAALCACTSEPAPEPDPGSESSSASELPPEPPAETLSFRSDDLGITFDLPDSLRGHSKIMVGEREAGERTVDTVTVYYMESPEQPEHDIHLLTVEIWAPEAWDGTQSTGSVIGEAADGRTAVLHTLQSNPFSEGEENYGLFQTLGQEIGIVAETFAFTNVG